MSIIAELRDRTTHSGVMLVHTGSEHILLSNVFGVIKNLPQDVVLKEMLKKTIGIDLEPNYFESVKYYFWEKFPAPKGLVEGFTEVDTVITFKDHVIFIEAKYLSEESKGTTHEYNRNQLIRNLDIVNIYSKKESIKNFYLIFLTCDESEPKIVSDIRLGKINSKLSTDTKLDDISNKIYWASWSDISIVLAKLAFENIFNKTELNFVRDILDYLCKKEIAKNALCSFNNQLVKEDYYKICRKSCNGFKSMKMFRNYLDESWKDETWNEQGLINLINSLSLKQKKLIHFLAAKGGGTYQYEIMANLDFLKGKDSSTLLGIKAGISRCCKSLNKMPLLSVGIGSRDERYHEINNDLGLLRNIIIEYVMKNFNF